MSLYAEEDMMPTADENRGVQEVVSENDSEMVEIVMRRSVMSVEAGAGTEVGIGLDEGVDGAHRSVDVVENTDVDAPKTVAEQVGVLKEIKMDGVVCVREAMNYADEEA